MTDALFWFMQSAFSILGGIVLVLFPVVLWAQRDKREAETDEQQIVGDGAWPNQPHDNRFSWGD